MLGTFSAGARIQAVEEKVDALNRCFEDLMPRIERLSDGLDRLMSDLERVQRQINVGTTDRRDQAAQLAAMQDGLTTLRATGERNTDMLAKLQAEGRSAADVAAELKAYSTSASAMVAEHASLLDVHREQHSRQDRSLEQVRADVARIERQAAADLTELRTTSKALARAVFAATRVAADGTS